MNKLEINDEDSPLRRTLLLNDPLQKELETLFPAHVNSASAASKRVLPHPGFCVKTRNETGEKVFINICHTTEIPPPNDITESELADILSSDEPSSFRIPMSLGEPHAEVDKSGKGCTAYDVVINSTFFEKLEGQLLYKTFLFTVTMEGLDDKYGTNLDKNGWIILKHKTYLGTLQYQNIQQRDKALIKEMSGGLMSSGNTGIITSNKQVSKKPLITELPGGIAKGPMDSLEKKKKKTPNFKLIREPAEGQPEFLIGEFQLPDVTSVSDLILDLGEDRILLEGKNSRYSLDIFIPFLIQIEESGAQFNLKNRVLTVTMPVKPMNAE